MGPEYGATIGYFPVDEKSMDYLTLTGRNPDLIKGVRNYLTNVNLFRSYDGKKEDPDFSGKVLELDLSKVEPSLGWTQETP
jgi:aconitate hydratase